MDLDELEIYQEVVDIKLGKRKQSSILQELSAWFRNEFDVSVLNFQFSEFPPEYLKGHYRLFLVIDDIDDDDEYDRAYRIIDTLNPAITVQPRIESFFRQLAIKHKFADMNKVDSIRSMTKSLAYNVRQIVSDQAADDVHKYFLRKYVTRRVNPPKNETLESDQAADDWQKFFARTYATKPVAPPKNDAGDKSLIWHVYYGFGEYVIFYYTAEDVKTNEQNGISDKLRSEFYEILKPYDEINYYSLENLDLSFDSKQNFEEKYQGRWDYYMRR